MSPSDFEVVWIVCGSYFYCPCAKFGINSFICNNGYFTSYHREYEHFANHFLVSFVIWVYRNGDVAQHRFGTCSGDCDEEVRFIPERVSDIPEMSFVVFMFYLIIGKGCEASRAPVNDVFAF